MDKNNEKQIVNQEEQAKFSVFTLIIILLLIVFVVFLPNIKNFYDKFKKAPKAPVVEVEVKPVEEETIDIAPVKEFVIALSKPATRNIELEELITAVAEDNPFSSGLNIKSERSVLSFTYGSEVANFKYNSDSLSAEIKIDDASAVFYSEMFVTLAKHIASLHGQSLDDLDYTFKSSSFKSYKAVQGLSAKEEGDKITYHIKTNVLFPLLDSTKTVITAEDIGLKENLISTDLNISKADLLLEIKAEEKLVITIGQKNYIDEITYTSLENIIEAIYGAEELENYKSIINQQNVDIKEDIYELEYLVTNKTNKFLEYNVIRLTVNKKII